MLNDGMVRIKLNCLTHHHLQSFGYSCRVNEVANNCFVQQGDSQMVIFLICILFQYEAVKLRAQNKKQLISITNFVGKK